MHLLVQIFIICFTCYLSSFSQTSPNIILIYIDDLGWADTSVEMIKGDIETKSDFYLTQNLERFALEGMVFSDAYASAPVCTPSRYSMLHGMTPAKLLNSTLNTKMAKEEYRGVVTIPQIIKKANPNYITAHFGKWHIPMLTPCNAGFDISDGATGNGEGDYENDMKTPLQDSNSKRMKSLTNKAKLFISDQVSSNRPFFMQLSHYAVHIWHDSSLETRNKYRKLPRSAKALNRDYYSEDEIDESSYKHNWIINYAAMIDELDQTIGELMDHLDQIGLKENTYVFFTSDNGGGLRGNAPLRGAKADLTEGGIRVPLIVIGPDVKKNSFCNIPVVGWDFLPTFYELTGGNLEMPSELDGGSLVDILKRGNKGKICRPHDYLVFHFPWYNGEPESAIRMGNLKLLKNLDRNEGMLFDLSNDIEEKNDLKNVFPEKYNLLNKNLNQYLDSVGAETVNQLRKYFLYDIENSWLNGAKERVRKLEAVLKNKDQKSNKEIVEAKKYVKWLEEQIVFTKNRIKLNESSNQ